MLLVEWNDGYSVQVPEMDAQHKHLFELLNKLHDAMSQGKGRAILPEVFDELIRYTKQHFAAEETLMQKYNYPGYLMHRRQHEDLVEQVGALQQRFLSGDFGASMQTRDFLKQWLVEHIIASDQKYGIFLKTKELFAAK